MFYSCYLFPGFIRGMSLISLTNTSSYWRIANPKGVYLDTHKGPLQTLTLALFGPDCFFEAWSRSKPPSQDAGIHGSGSSDPVVCLSMAPLGGLFLNQDGFLDYGTSLQKSTRPLCLSRVVSTEPKQPKKRSTSG